MTQDIEAQPASSTVKASEDHVQIKGEAGDDLGQGCDDDRSASELPLSLKIMDG